MVSHAVTLGWRLTVIGLALVAVVLAAFAAGIAVNRTFAQPDANTIYACKGERSGAVRLVDAGQNCLRGEEPVSWNIEGPPGLSGYVRRQASVPSNWSSIAPGERRFAFPSCETGEHILSAGFFDLPAGLHMESSFAQANDAWFFEVVNALSLPSTIDASETEVTSICATVAD